MLAAGQEMLQFYFAVQCFQELGNAVGGGGKVEITIGTGLLAKWDMNIYTCQ